MPFRMGDSIRAERSPSPRPLDRRYPRERKSIRQIFALWGWSSEQKPRNQSRRLEQSLRQPIESFRCFFLSRLAYPENPLRTIKVAFCNCLIPVSFTDGVGARTHPSGLQVDT